MNKTEIILSSGSIPWLGLKQALNYAIEGGFDGLEVVPTRKIIGDVENVIKVFGQNKWTKGFANIASIKGIHQSWRLDIGLDKEYKINFLLSMFFTIIRILLFPKTNKSQKIIELISKKLNLPVTVHDISSKWTRYINEFSGGILLELIGEKINPEEIKKWLANGNHKIVVDTRDDQSLLWAKYHDLNNWKQFWEWLGVENIGGVQLTLIGIDGLKKISAHRLSTAENQFLWLNKQKWTGVITIEINPLMLYFASKGRFKYGLQTIVAFVRQTLIEGKAWSS